jgi:uroporphyrinogen decarboxylase
VEEAFLDRLYPKSAAAPYSEKMTTLMEDAGLDLISLTMNKGEEDEGLAAFGRWVKDTPYFVMALVDGLFWNPDDPLRFEDFVLGISRDEEGVRELIKKKKKKALHLIKRCLDQGVDGLIIGDDLAYDRGPFISPKILSDSIFPRLHEMVEVIHEAGRVAFLHSCGNLGSLMDMILSCGFDGLHGLAPASGNDPMDIRRKTKGRLTLMGIFDLDGMKPEAVKALKENILGVFRDDGGYILGSAAGLSSNTPIETYRALYQ